MFVGDGAPVNGIDAAAASRRSAGDEKMDRRLSRRVTGEA